MEHIENCNYNYYALEMNLLKLILEKNYNKEVKGIYFVTFHPTKKNFTRFEIPDMCREVLEILKLRVEDLYGAKYRDLMKE